MKRLLAGLVLAAVVGWAGGAAAQPQGPAPGRPAFGKALGRLAPGKGLVRPAPHATAPHGQAPARAAHGAAHGGAHAVHVNWYSIRPPAGENQPFLASLFNFIVLGLLLGRFGYPPIREFVKARHEKIAKDLNEGRALREQAELRLKEYEAKIANLDQDIAALLQGLRAEGEAERARIVAAAEEQAARLRRDAELTISQDMRRARAEIEREAITAAITTAERILRERVTDADQRAFVEKYLLSLATDGPAAGPGVSGRGAA